MADIIFWKPKDFCGTLYSKVFEVTDYELTSNFRNSKWRMQYGGDEILGILRFRITLYSGIFGVADYEFQNEFL